MRYSKSWRLTINLHMSADNFLDASWARMYRVGDPGQLYSRAILSEAH